MCVNKSYERTIPEVMWYSVRISVLSRCKVGLGIVQISRALSQVSTSFSICMPLLQTVSESCHRPEELFQAIGAVSWELHTRIMLTKTRYEDIVQSHTDALHQSQRAMTLDEWPRTHLCGYWVSLLTATMYFSIDWSLKRMKVFIY